MIRFIEVARDSVWFLGEWSLRWGVLIAIVAVWFGVRAPRRSDVRYAIAWSVLLAGLCLPLLPQWGPGIWCGRHAGTGSVASTAERGRHSTQPAEDSDSFELSPVLQPITPLEMSWPEGYSGSSLEDEDAGSDAAALTSATESPDALPAASGATDPNAIASGRGADLSLGSVCYIVLAIAYLIGVGALIVCFVSGLMQLRRLDRGSVAVMSGA